MIINSLFLQSAEGSGGAINALGMQKSDSAGYLFSDIIKVHLGSEATGEAGLSETKTGGPGLFSGGKLGPLLALIQKLSGKSELPDNLKALLKKDNLLKGELNATGEELENILASLINQPNVKIFGINQVSGKAVSLNNLEEIKKYLAENKEIFISAKNGSNSLKINLAKIENGKKSAKIALTENGNEPNEFKISFNFEKSAKVSDELQSKPKPVKVIDNKAGVVTEKGVKVKLQTSEKGKSVVDAKIKSGVADNQNITPNKTKQTIGKNKSDAKLAKLQSEISAENKSKNKSELKAGAEKPLTGSVSVDPAGKKTPAKNESVKANLTQSSESSKKKEMIGSESVKVNEQTSVEKRDSKTVNGETVKNKGKGNFKVSVEAGNAEVETKKETNAKAEEVNVSAKRSVKPDKVNVNGKTIITNETKADPKPDSNTTASKVASSDTATSMGSDSDSAKFSSSEDSKSSLSNMRNSNQETHHSTKFIDLVNEKINKEQFLVKTEASKVVKAAELVKEISKYIQSQDKNSLTINIEPEHLGKVKILMEVTDKVVKAHIEVDNEVAKHMVETNIRELHSSTQKSGLELAQVNISLSNTNQKNQKHFADKNKNSDKKSNKVTDENIAEESENQQLKNLGYNTVEYVA